MIEKVKDPDEPYSSLEVVQAPALALDYGKEPALALDYGFQDPNNLPEVVESPGLEVYDETKNNGPANANPQRKIFGLLQHRKRWAAVAFGAIIVIGGAIGGGIAGSNAMKANQAPNHRDRTSPGQR
jgi:hypothetical protein